MLFETIRLYCFSVFLTNWSIQKVHHAGLGCDWMHSQISLHLVSTWGANINRVRGMGVSRKVS